MRRYGSMLGDANVRFGFSDFTLITGLNPGIENDFVKDIPSDRRLAAEYFAGGKKVWAFETFPAVCRLFRTERTEQRLPKMCGWRSTTTFGYFEIIAVLDEPMDEVLFPLSPTQEEMEKEYVVMFPGVFPDDISYPLDEHTVPTDDREMVEETDRERERERDMHTERVRAYKCATRGCPWKEHGGSSRVPPPSTGPSIGMRQVLDVVATLIKKQDDAFSFLNKKVEYAFSLMSGKIEELDRKIYALDQNLKQEVTLYVVHSRGKDMETGPSPIMGRWWRQRRLRVRLLRRRSMIRLLRIR
ncbi:hypothetical protein DH2020_003120 [Rehmannia glutinosa]|uniref:Uncharacterized protein n=1 Tax=Rehmannia glutinosa TaxID=99300 RepID=A0ABR0XKN0_REHGL